MKALRSFNSGAFRFAVVVAALFAAGSIVVLFVVERSISAYELEATRSSLQAETIILTRELPDGGVSELIDTIDHRQVQGIEQQFRYALVRSTGLRLAGDMPLPVVKIGWGSVRFVEDHPPPGEEGVPETLQTLGSKLPGGLLLVVGTDTYDIYKLRERLHNVEVMAAVIVTLLALGGGYATGVVFLRRLERVNGSVARIMAGRLSERLPPIGMAPEFDRLSSNLNLMLDRIGELMEGLRQVSNDIAHDLSTPLTRLRQTLETIQDGESMDVMRERAEIALAQTDDMRTMFRALLRIGVIEAGEARELFGPVDLSEIADKVVQIYRPAAEDGHRHLIAHLKPAEIVGDGELLAQVFANLIDNAIKYTPPGATITVTVEASDRGAAITVADDGPGVPSSEFGKILRRFYRLDASRSQPGSGLGLSMVQAVARLHGGSITIEANDPGLRVTVSISSTEDSFHLKRRLMSQAADRAH